MKKSSIALFLVLCSYAALAQSTFIPYNRDYYHLIDRFQILYGNESEFWPSTFKPIRRADLASLLETVKTAYPDLSPQDQFNFQYLMNDNWEWTRSEYNKNDRNWWDLFYRQKSDFYAYRSDRFDLHLNPVAHFAVGKDQDEDKLLFTNLRGVEARGMIDQKIGFYTFLSTTQARFPRYVFEYIRGTKRAFPNEGFWKPFGEDGWDLLHARGYLTFNLTPSINVQAGYDKNFIGDGLRSMVLSDFSAPYLFLKINTQAGPFHYTNLFAELTEDIIFGNLDPGDGNYPKKYMAYHRLGLRISKKLQLGVFEAIISEKANLNYFNPIIFYRAIEQQQGSPHNALLGLDYKLNLFNRFSFYGQFMLDEFLIDALRDGNGDWRNKFGIQLGGQYINAFNIASLDLRAEVNLARPYFYAYETPALSYTHYRNPLAHPLGANFKELLFTARYQPVDRLFLTGKFIYSDFGEDDQGLNFGGNLLLSTDDRIGNTGNTIGQGLSSAITYLEFTGSYMVMHNLFIDLKNRYRRFDSALDERDRNSFMTTVSLRWNLPQREHEF